MADLILSAFANDGDVSIPPQTDSLGFVNFKDGYTEFYELNLASGNTQAKAVERPIQNYLFNLLTGNALKWQRQTYAPWFAATPGGYAKDATVMGNDGRPYRSLVAGNQTVPETSPASWEYQPTGSELRANVPMPSGGSRGATGLIITAATDLNTLGTGTFAFGSDAVAAGSANSPSTKAGVLECLQWNNGIAMAMQRYIDNAGVAYARAAVAGAWTPWQTVAYLASPALTGTPTTPTPPQFDTSNQIANMSAVQRALGNFQGLVSLNASATITTAQLGSFVTYTGAAGATITLPSTTGMSGNGLAIANKSANNLTISAAAGQTVDFGNVTPVSALTQIIPPFGTLILACNGQSWTAVAQGGGFIGQGNFKSGTMLMWPSMNLPSWALPRDGSAVSRTVYAALFAVLCPQVQIGITSGSPNCTTASTKFLYCGMPLEAAGFAAGTTVLSITGAGTFVASANASATASVAATIFPFGYGASGNATTFGLPDDRGLFERGLDDGTKGFEGSQIAFNITSGSSTATTTGSTKGLFVGMSISHANYAPGTTITSVSATQITTSNNPSASLSGAIITFVGGQLGNDRADDFKGHSHTLVGLPTATTPAAGGVAGQVTMFNANQTTSSTGGFETRGRFRNYLPIIAF